MLVLLPGMHGSGVLFQALLSRLALPSAILELPDGEDQSPRNLAKIISQQLPSKKSILLAESFSGCLIPELMILCPEKIAGVIFVASFVSCPNKFLLGVACAFPNFILRNKLLLRLALKVFFLNGNADRRLLDQCVHIINELPTSLIKMRLKTMWQLRKSDQHYNVPAVYIRAAHDRVLSAKSYQNILNNFNPVEMEVSGPHFLLQTKPLESARLIELAVEKMLGSS